MRRLFGYWGGGSPDAPENEESIASEDEQEHVEDEGDDMDADDVVEDAEADATESGIEAAVESPEANGGAADLDLKKVRTEIIDAVNTHYVVESGDGVKEVTANTRTDTELQAETKNVGFAQENTPSKAESIKEKVLSSTAAILDADDSMARQNQSEEALVIYESIGDDLVIPVATTSATVSQDANPPLSASDPNQVDNTSGTDTEQHDDSFPKAKDFLADLISVHEEEETSTILPEQAAKIVCGFDEEGDGNNDDRTVVTMRTTATGMTAASRRIHSSLREETPEQHVSHEHKSLFDILDRNFEELGDCRADGLGSGRDIGYMEVKLCFVAFVVVFGVPQPPAVVEANACVSREEEKVDEKDDDEHEMKEQMKQTPPTDEVQKVPRPNVPLSVAFALWKQVLRHPQYGKCNAVSATMLSYIRSTLVLLGLLELSSIDNEDAPVPTSTAGRSRYQLKSSAIECLRVHHDINQQYGEYLAWADHDSSFRSTIEQHQRQWNDAVMDESLQIGSNDFTIRMLPLNTMRAHHMQETFDLLKDKSFIRRRVRLLGSLDAAAAHIRDVDELLRIIDKRVKANDVTLEAVDEQDGVLNAYEQMKKYCLYLTNELMKHNITDDKNIPEGVNITGLTKAALSKISNAGDALHLLGASLGGYGFFDQEMDYYKEALRLKELCSKGKAEQLVAVSDTLHCMGFSLDNAGKSEEALDFYDRALDIRLDYLGVDDLRVAETLHNKGALLCEADRSEEAMECLEEALRIRELHYGEEHESCADTMQWMGNLLRKHGDPSDALDYFKFSLRIKQTRLGADHIDVANTLFNTAVLLDDVEKYELSLIAYKEACRIRKLVLGEQSPDVADNLFCLGNVATAMERHEEALGYFNESIKIREALIKEDDIYSVNLDDSLLFISNPTSMNPGLLMQYERLSQCLEEVLPLTKLLEGTNHENVCKLLKRMGDVYKKLQDWDNAIGSIQGALRVKRGDKASTEDDLEVAQLLQRKGEAHLYKAEFSRAKSTFDAALQVREKLLGRESVEFACSLYCLGTAYHCLKEFARSRLLFQECIRIQTKLLGKEDLRIAQSMCWMGRNHQELNEPSKALEKYLSALLLCKKNKGTVDYRIVVMLLHAIGLIYEDDTINLLDMALKCYTEEIHLIETKLDVEDIEVTKILVLAHLKAGLLYQKQEDVDDSIEHLTLGLDLTKQWNDDSQDSTMAMITDTLGVLYVSREDYETAKKFFSDSYSIYEKTLGRDHATTADCAFKLADCLEHVGSNLALDFYAESLRVHRLNITDDDERVGKLLFSIGKINFGKEMYIDAANSFDEALNVQRRLLGDCATVATTYHELANSYVQMKQYEKGLILYKECVRITKKHGEKDDLYSVALDMASCCEIMENYKLAIECYNDCLRATEELNDDHNIAFVLQRMGEIQLTRLHKYSDATKLFLDALELLRAEECMSEEDQCSVLCLIFQVGQAYALAKDYENALDFYEEHIKLVESREPVDDELVANSLLEMGMILSVMGDKPDYELAAEKVSESLDIRRKILGPDNEQVADVLYKLAEIYEKSEEYTQAVDCLSESLRTFKMKNMYSKASAAYHTLAKLKASAAEKSGADSDRKAAIECYEAAISTRRQDPALDDLELASMLYEYATLQCLDNNYDSATPLLNEALCIQKSKKGLKNERVANILLRTAECHVHGNKYDASLLCLEQALFIQSSLEKCDIDAVLLNHLLGITYLERENYPKAVSTSLAALKLMKMEGCEDSLECADVYNNLGKAYGKLHDYDKAIESLVEALRIQKVELGNDSLEYAESVLHLAEIHVSTKKHAQALNCLEESIRVFKAFPDEENTLIYAIETAADCQFILKDYRAAESSFHECINLVESQDIDTNDERLASLLHRLGKTGACSNDYENAFTSYREAIKLYTKALGSDNLHVADVLFDVGLLTLDDDENEKAAQCFNEVMRIYTHNGQEHSTKVADALIQMGTIYANNSEDEEAAEAVNKALILYNETLESDAVEIGKALLLRGRLNDHAGDYVESMSNFTEALRIFQTTLDENDMNVSLALSNMGVAHARIKQYSEAIEKCKEALRIRKLHTDNDRDVADSLFDIGNLYDEWGKYEEAVPYLKGSLKLYRRLFGDEDISIANCQNKLGSLYWKLGDTERAIDSFTDALYVCEEADGEDEHEGLLVTVYKGLGDCYFHTGELDLALESFISCVKMQKVVFGDDCIEMAATCECIGLVYEKKNKHEEAMQFYNKALALFEQHLGKSSSECLGTHMKISNALLSESKYEDAIHNLRECAQLYTKERRGGKSEEVAMIYHQLGMAQGKIGNHEDAIGSLNKALNIRTKINGKVDIKVAETMVDIGSALHETSESDEALVIFDEVITILQQLPESDQFKIPDVYTAMTEILNDQGKYETSLNTLKQALKLYNKHHESDSIQVAKTLIRLGQVYNELGNLEKATGCYSEGIKIFRLKTLERSADDNIFMSQAMGQLGKVYARKKMHGKAIELCTESLKIQKKYSSDETISSVAQSCLVIADILSEWGKADQALQFFEEALRIYKENVGPESTQVATCYHGIGLAQKRMGDNKTAMMNFGKSLRINRGEEGDKSLPVADDLFQIGQIYDSFLDKSKAYQCFQECLKIRQANLSDDDLDLLAARRYVDTLKRKLER